MPLFAAGGVQTSFVGVSEVTEGSLSLIVEQLKRDKSAVQGPLSAYSANRESGSFGRELRLIAEVCLSSMHFIALSRTLLVQ